MRILVEGLAEIPEAEGVRASERKVSEQSEWVRRERGVELCCAKSPAVLC